jgi:hypothetical protein
MSEHDVIFREVDEELRRERMRTLWGRFGPYVIAAAVAVVLVVAANEGWAWWRHNQESRASDEFYAALKLSDGGDLAGADAALDKIVAQGGGYATLARFKEASLLAKQGKPADAVAAYDAIAGDETNARLRELALVMAANILVDTGSLADVESRVSSMVSTGSPMRNAAREAVGLAQYKAGDLDAARQSFEAIVADPLAPPELQSRVQIFLAQITAEAGAPASDTVSDTAPAADTAPAPAEEPAAEAAPADQPADTVEQKLNDAASMMQMMAPSAETAPAAPAESAPSAAGN